jgi:trigger factor
MKYQIEESGMKVEDSGFEPERAKTEWREKALFNSKGYMILEGLANKEGVRVTQDDMDKEYKKLAEATKKDVKEIQANLMQNPDSLSQTTSKLLGQKMMDFLYSHCEFEYVKELEPEATPADSEQKPA